MIIGAEIEISEIGAEISPISLLHKSEIVLPTGDVLLSGVVLL